MNVVIKVKIDDAVVCRFSGTIEQAFKIIKNHECFCYPNGDFVQTSIYISHKHNGVEEELFVSISVDKQHNYQFRTNIAYYDKNGAYSINRETNQSNKRKYETYTKTDFLKRFQERYI